MACLLKNAGTYVKLLLVLQTLFFTSFMTAQNNPKPTLEDLIPGGATYRYPESIYGVQWKGDLCVLPDIENLKVVSPNNGKEVVIATKTEVNQLLESMQLGKIQHFYNIEFPYSDNKELSSYMLVTTSGYRVLVDINSKEIKWSQPRKENASNEDWEKQSRSLAYTLDNNLYVTTADGSTRAVTKEEKGIVCGQSVHRNEFGISKGTFWSPKGSLLAFYRMDERMVTEYPLVDITARVGTVNNVRYPMAGMTSHQVTVGIYNPQTDKSIYLQTGDPTNRYFTNISWSPDEKSLYLIELNRDQNHAKLCEYNAQTGALIQTLFEERHPKYVEPQHPIVFLPWNSNEFIYQSQKNGFNHLYLYNRQGKQLKQLTSGKWLVKELIGFDEKNKYVFFTSTELSPLQENIYRLDVKSVKRILIGNNEGVHAATVSRSGKYLIDRYSSTSVPRSINLIDIKTNKSINLLTAANPFEGFVMPTIEVGTIKAADEQTDLYYRMVKPSNFDPSLKYPVIVYVYGGPHAQMITNAWQNSARGWDIYMANKGYIVFTLDNRGSDNRGLEFENCTFRHLGIEEGKDQVKGVQFLKSLPYIDSNRVGVHGWSFGGHMTTALLLRYPDIFKTGVAGGPVIDWSYYEVMYGERYMDTPDSNPEGYQACNLKNLAGNLKGHLLIIHDDHDDTCVPQHTLSFMKACIDARTYPDLFIYPGHKHNVAGRDRVHLHEKITRYFEDNL